MVLQLFGSYNGSLTFRYGLIAHLHDPQESKGSARPKKNTTQLGLDVQELVAQFIKIIKLQSRPSSTTKVKSKSGQGDQKTGRPCHQSLGDHRNRLDNFVHARRSSRKQSCEHYLLPRVKTRRTSRWAYSSTCTSRIPPLAAFDDHRLHPVQSCEHGETDPHWCIFLNKKQGSAGCLAWTNRTSLPRKSPKA